MAGAGVTVRSPALFRSKRQDWCSPAPVLERVRRLGPIGLDPCSNSGSEVMARVALERSVRCLTNKESALHDGLYYYWGGHGLVYCNPPYTPSPIRWLKKGLEAEEIVYLLPSRTDTKWFQRVNEFDIRVGCFWRGRLKFLGAKDMAPFPSVVLYGGPQPERFAEIFADAGRVMWFDQVEEKRHEYSAEIPASYARRDSSRGDAGPAPLRPALHRALGPSRMRSTQLCAV